MHYLNIVPVFEDTDYMVREARRIAKEVGIKTPAFSFSLHPTGTPAITKAERFAAVFKQVREALSDDSEIRPGILIQSLLGHGWSGAFKITGETWQRIVLEDGSENGRMCPLDPGFRDYSIRAIGMLAALKPAFMFVDDDFGLRDRECFCPRHWDLYMSGTGRKFDSPAEFYKYLESADKRDPILRHFEAVRVKTALDFAADIRKEIDRHDPSIRCGMCISFCAHVFAEKCAKILAGNTKPFVRIANSCYCTPHPLLYACLPGRNQIRKFAVSSIEDVIDEADTWPHSVYSVTPAGLLSHLANAALDGLVGAKLWITSLHGKYPESGKEYEKVLARNIPFLEKLSDSIRGIRWQGPVVPIWNLRDNYHPIRNRESLEDKDWGTILFHRFGLPCAYEHSSRKVPRMLTGIEAERFSDAELRCFLEGGLLLDATAAEVFARRGFEKFLGIELKHTPEFYFNAEYDGDGNCVALLIEPGMAELAPLSEKTQIVTKLYHESSFGEEKKYSAPGMTFFENEFGGRIVVTAWKLDMAYQKLFAYGRRKRLLKAYDFLCGDKNPLTVENYHDVSVRHGIMTDGLELAAIYNCGLDAMENILLRLTRLPKKIERLTSEGTWKNVRFHRDESGFYALDIRLESVEFGIFSLCFPKEQ